MNRYARLAPALALALLGAATSAAQAEVVTVMSIDPTSTRVYWQFSVDQPAEAYKIFIRDSSGVIVRSGLYDPAGLFWGHASFMGGLTPATNYTLNIRVRWPDSPAFDPEWVTVPFTTNP